MQSVLEFPTERRNARKVDVNAQALAADLRRVMRGEVRFDDTSRGLYATDASNYRQVPIGVVLPRDADDVVAGMEICRRHRAPVLPRGGGTSLCGQCCNVAVVFDLSKYMNRILEIDPERRIARVQPGVVLDDLRAHAERHHLTFAPDPATHTHNTLGGMIGNNSCGPHSVMAGRTSDNIFELDVLTYDGERMRVGATNDDELERIVAAGDRRGRLYQRMRELRDRHAAEIRRRYPDIPRLVSGYNFAALLPEHGFNVARALVGSEGTCAMVLEAVVQLVPSPPSRVLVVLGYPDVYSAGDHVPEVMRHGPIATEGIDDRLIRDMKAVGLNPGHAALLPPGGGWLLVEFGGSDCEEAVLKARRMMHEIDRGKDAPRMKLFERKDEQESIWAIRESGLGATAHVPHKPMTWEGWEDSAVPPKRLGEYLRRLRKLLDRYGYECDLYGHFGQGCVHTRIDFDLQTQRGIRTFRSFVEEAADLVVSLGGSFSGEHGDGQSKAEFLPRMFGKTLVAAFGEFKSIWDPDWRMNPGKLVDPYRIDENLRLGAAYRPPQPETRFHYPGDSGQFARATLRCVGVGKCRKQSGLMCPSYQATGEEMHSTRGRAHLLWEMLQGDVVKGGWRDEGVKEALHLCLSCKGCKGECPVKVDMAVYKAEFMSHYYQGRLRPRNAYAFGLVDVWSRLASRAPALVNLLTRTPVLAPLLKKLAKMPPERQIPQFAPYTFKEWFARRGPGSTDGPEVMLWPDTFNNHFRPETAQAAVEVLENAGYRVRVPRQTLCCGRPLYEFGMMNLAQRRLRRILDALSGPIQAGIPMIVLEPACASVFVEEMASLFPGDENAKRLREQVFLLPDFLERQAGYQPPPLHRRALVQGHCHHQSVLGMDAERAMLDKLGLQCEVLDAGCCGMAGSFGMEADKYEVAMRIGERVLLPAVRKAEEDVLVIADGYSCREQIAQSTDRRALHVAQVLQMSLRQAQLAPRVRPERMFEERRMREARAAQVGLLLTSASFALGLALALGYGRKRLRT